MEPALYKEAAEIEGRYDPDRDVFESGVIDRALDDDTPLLGICRGAQLLNVRLGGTLFQDLQTRRVETSNRRTLLPLIPLKTLCVENDTLLGDLLRAHEARINSLHRQSIRRLGDGLRVAGRDLDGIVKAVELAERRFVFGLQWHPELLIYIPRQLRVFRALVEASREYRGREPRSSA